MEEAKKIYIGNLSFSITEQDLKKILEEKGVNASQVNLITESYSGRSKGFGFAEFETEEEALKAIEVLNDQEVSGRKLNVSKARKTKPKRDNFGGKRRGQDNSRRGGFKRRERYQ